MYFMLYSVEGENIIPKGEMVHISMLKVDDVVMMPECGEEGMTYIPYRVLAITAKNRIFSIQWERVM